MSLVSSRVSVVAGLATLCVASLAWSAPAVLAPGDSGVPIPTFSGSAPTVTELFDTKGNLTENGMTISFEEFALSTSLNPSGVTFGFAITASNNPTSLSASLGGFGGFMTSVESCDPFSQSVAVCSMQTGMAARSSGMGDTLTFSALGTTPVSLPVQPPLFASNLYGVFTNAPGFTTPTMFTVSDNGTTFTFNGVGPSASSAVPEPATLALLSLGLLGIAAAQRRQRSSMNHGRSNSSTLASMPPWRLSEVGPAV
jgi:hypothetical protein